MADAQSLASLRENKAAYEKFFADNDKLGSLLGNKLVSLSKEECVCEYAVSAAHFNPNKILHGGALYTAMDSSQGLFVHYILDAKYRCAATGTASIRYEAPLTSGKVRIRTWLARQDGRKLFIGSEAHNDEGKLVAKLEETWIAIQ